MLDVSRLRVLVAVARHGSVTAAAQALHYAQPSVSHHLARLEAETGSRLVQRAGRGIRLTDAGRMLAERAEEILGRLDAAEAELAAHTGLRSGRVRLAAFPSALGTFVPVAAAAFAAEHPGVDLRFTEAGPPAAVRLLRSGEVEAAVLFTYPGEPAPDLDGLRHELLLEEPIHLVTPADRPGGTLADHRDRPWISGCERCRAELVRLCAVAGFTPEVRFTTDDFVAVQALVAAGLGGTVLPGLALAAHHNPDVRTVALDSRRTVYVAVYGDVPDPPATTALLRHLRTAARAL
ncbi:DNA-binding transcriptional LysR family regulator [Actinoplanes octamycinicus]|uniref:DNA-binding transcriptional LysR family regulator n=1 Tax=Actinoplanes octamycinicus TaxID=135948 RepID=A0A7W7GRF2_9ACTN|nr:LysR family transcriptional regulator [Actinoplanes octamycinicus]MBB4736883.1 DNA-binding transcriptional LysR family regulator [Actinoplanes octamycinicus]GIE63321.1 LysR family transcriptional regulator [Actinoplanes octamycinicus]